MVLSPSAAARVRPALTASAHHTSALCSPKYQTRPVLPALVALAVLLTGASVAGAQGTGNFPDSTALVTRLGKDTLAVEHVVRTGNVIEADVLLRTPKTARTRYRMELAADAATLPFIDMVHWPFEPALERLRASGRDSIIQPLLTGARTSDFRIGAIGSDSATITHPFRGTMSVRTDRAGRLIGLDAGATTRALIVERRPWLGLDALATRWQAEDEAGHSFGALSGRGETVADVGGARLAFDYGTPVRRGRAIWGALVPWGELWRTGANLATHFTTDQALVLGQDADTLAVPAGRYTLFSIPGTDGGTLIVNRQTGQNGNSYDAAQDLGRVKATFRPLAQSVELFTITVDGTDDRGSLRLQWADGELVVPFRVR